MKKHIGIISFLLISGSFSGVSAQQLSQLTMFNRSLILYNPAVAGSDGALNLTLFHRSQWSALEGAPSSQALLAHTPITRNMAFGGSLYNDKLGPHDNVKITGSYAYRIAKNENDYLAFGLQVGYGYYKSDFSQLTDEVFQPTDPQLQGIVVQQGTPEFGVGITLVKPRFSLGVSALNLIPKEAVVTDSASLQLGQTNYFAHGQYVIHASPTLRIIPSLLYKHIDGLPSSFDASLRFWYKDAVMTGINYRDSESLAFSLQLKLSRQLSVGYAYDWLIGDVSALSNGSNELFVSYVFKFSEKLVSPR